MAAMESHIHVNSPTVTKQLKVERLAEKPMIMVGFRDFWSLLWDCFTHFCSSRLGTLRDRVSIQDAHYDSSCGRFAEVVKRTTKCLDKPQTDRHHLNQSESRHPKIGDVEQDRSNSQQTSFGAFHPPTKDFCPHER